MAHIRSLLFSIGMLLSIAIIAPLVLLAFPLSVNRRYQITKIWSRFNLWWLNFTCRIDYRVSGLENLPDGAAIVLSKHQSTWETIYLHYMLPPLAIVLKKELLWLPLFGWALALLDPIAIDRKSGRNAAKQIIRRGKQHLDQGQWVLLFPEGTRTPPGVRIRYRIGGALLASASGYPIIPIAHNAGYYWPRKGFIKRPGTVQVVIGPPIDSKGQSPEKLLAQTEQWIESTMSQITGQEETFVASPSSSRPPPAN